MSSSYRVKTVVLASGERLPVLLDREGQPMFAPTVLVRMAQAATADGYSGSDRWLDHHRATVDRLNQLCSIMDDPEVPNGAVIQLAAPAMPLQMESGTERGLFQPGGEQLSLLADVKALLGE